MKRVVVAIIVAVLGVLAYAIASRESKTTRAELCYEPQEGLTVCAKTSHGCFFPSLACIQEAVAMVPKSTAVCIRFSDGDEKSAQFAVGSSSEAVRSLVCLDFVDEELQFVCK